MIKQEKLKRLKSSSQGIDRLKILNDRVLVLPEELSYEGASADVVDALNKKKLVLADAYEAAFLKRPQWGKVVQWGDKCKYTWHVGQTVAFPRDGWAKLHYLGTEYLLFAESQLNATIT